MPIITSSINTTQAVPPDIFDLDGTESDIRRASARFRDWRSDAPANGDLNAREGEGVAVPDHHYQ